MKTDADLPGRVLLRAILIKQNRLDDPFLSQRLMGVLPCRFRVREIPINTEHKHPAASTYFLNLTERRKPLRQDILIEPFTANNKKILTGFLHRVHIRFLLEDNNKLSTPW